MASINQLPRVPCAFAGLLLASLAVFSTAPAPAQPAPAAEAAPLQWYKGNLHTHSLWSDGDDYPEMIADWYKRNGYHFLGLSDHNVLQQGDRWLELKAPVSVGGQVMMRGGGPTLEKYVRRFGPDWVEQREVAGKKEIRLKPLSEYRPLLEESGRFLMIPMEEISSAWKRPKTATSAEMGGPVHVNITNPLEFVPPAEGDNPITVMQRVVDAVLEQRKKTGQPMFPHINHPNFRWSFTAEDLMKVRGARFFEVYNGHPGVNNAGDATRLSMDAMWDAALAHRLTDLDLGIMYGVGIDDSHNYHAQGIGKSNTGRGWVMVRARRLTPESIVHAMEAGDFYSSTGVVLSDVRRSGRELALEIQPERGVTYTTQFIGTRKNFNPATELLEQPADEKAPRRTPAHRRYSKDVGAVLAEVKGTRAAYTLKGDEIYVRAKVISSKAKVNGSVADEFETAWTQPLVNPAK
ncbi:MAG: hypothetical protein Q7S40_17120 [Opitutaceae bacterium]|nr:hypothetical protein [Opitutaceae bacterium]